MAPPEGEVIATPSNLWPLFLLWYGSAGLTAACGVGVLRFADSLGAGDGRKKAARAVRDDPDLADHHGSTPGERDAAVVFLFACLATYLLGYVDLGPLVTVVATFGAAYHLGYSQGVRDAAPEAAPRTHHRKPAARPTRPRPRPGAIRRVRSANNLLLYAPPPL